HRAFSLAQSPGKCCRPQCSVTLTPKTSGNLKRQFTRISRRRPHRILAAVYCMRGLRVDALTPAQAVERVTASIIGRSRWFLSTPKVKSVIRQVTGRPRQYGEPHHADVRTSRVLAKVWTCRSDAPL